ncbi:MAG: hypothetical protein H0X38_14800, partial [Planctomycetes bacterium]|nr:hypothetical protein [Planctomycetota bacterium]
MSHAAADERRGPGFWKDPVLWLLFAVALAALLSIALCVARCVAVFGDMRLFATSGGEGVAIHSVWKAAHGGDVYLPPGQGVYESAFYNFLFYDGYGGFCALIGADDDHLVAASRLLTCAAGLLGAFAQWRVLGLLLPGPFTTRERWLLAGLVALTWYGSSFMNWWLFTVRPDVPAVSLAMVGLWLALRALRRRSPWSAALAALAFSGAWALKQSVVWMLTGAVLSGFLKRPTRWTAVTLALLMFTAFGATMALGTVAYRYQVFYAPSLDAIVPGDALFRFQQLLPPLLLFWFFAILPALLRLRPSLAGRLAELPIEQAETWRTVAIASLIAVGMGIIALGKDGSGRNHLMEGVVLVSTLAAASLVRVLRMEPGRLRTGLVVCAVAFALMLGGRPNNSLFLDSTGVRGGSSDDVAWHRKLQEVLASAPKPAFVSDDILAQPWYANEGRYPG